MKRVIVFQALTVLGICSTTGFAAEERTTVEITPLGAVTPAQTSGPIPAAELNDVATKPLQTVVIQPAAAEQTVPAVPTTPAPIPAGVNPNQANQPVVSGSSVPTLQSAPTNLPATVQMPLIIPAPQSEQSPDRSTPSQVALYRDIYYSIPFRRAEYNANPSYRHEATIELLFNQMRPMTIQRSTSNIYHYDGGAGYWGDPPYYPYSYGLRIHRSR